MRGLTQMRRATPSDRAFLVDMARLACHLDPSAILRIVRHSADRAEPQAMGTVAPTARHALERGATVHLVQATLGHASVATTGRYLHARPTDSSARYTSG